MTLMALNYEGDGLQPNCSKKIAKKGASSGRVLRTTSIAATRVDSVWEAQRTGR